MTPIVIHNDTSVNVHIQLKKQNLNSTNYTLYVAIKQIDNISMPMMSTGTRDKHKPEAAEQKIIHEIDMSEDNNDFDEDDSEFVEKKINFDVTDNKIHREVEVDQCYKNKEVLISVMQN